MSLLSLVEHAATLIPRDEPTTTAILSSDLNIAVDQPMASMTAMASALATASSSVLSASATATAAPTVEDEIPQGECRLLGPFALIIQIALGALALLSLVYKRWRERPQRPVKIWFFDVSKQVVGSVLVHIVNVLMSMLTSGRFSVTVDASSIQTAQRMLRRDDDQYIPNPCSFYLLNLAIDTTIGIPILLVLLKITTGLVSYTPLGNPPESIQSGHYGNPPRAWWWLKQSFIYFCGLFGMKICVLVLFLILPWISKIGDWALKWTEGNEHLQIFFVMMLFPLVMNALQYYIIDSFIKQKEPAGHQRLASEDDGEDDPFDNALVDSESEDSDSGESQESLKMSKTKIPPRDKDEDAEYDPNLDGKTVVGSSKSHLDRNKLLPEDLVPPE